MKKTILALLVLLTAALIFTGCPKEPEVPESTPETLNLEGTWLSTKSCHIDEEDPESPTFEAVIMKLEITSTAFSVYQITDDCSMNQFMKGVMTAGLTQEELAALYAEYPQLAEDIELEWKETPFMSGSYSVSGTTPSFTIEGVALPVTLSADKTSITLSIEDELTGEPESMVFVKQ
ncbi:MAG: hypothetical protein KBT02_05265 [Treponema sp.]|nr:hypothetical protein [Candidatus Treponema caballi]